MLFPGLLVAAVKLTVRHWLGSLRLERMFMLQRRPALQSQNWALAEEWADDSRQPPKLVSAAVRMPHPVDYPV